MVTKYGSEGSTLRHVNKGKSGKSAKSLPSAPCSSSCKSPSELCSSSKPKIHEAAEVLSGDETDVYSDCENRASSFHTPIKTSSSSSASASASASSCTVDHHQEKITLSDGHTFTCCDLGICRGGNDDAVPPAPKKSASTDHAGTVVPGPGHSHCHAHAHHHRKSVMHAAAAIDTATAPKSSSSRPMSLSHVLASAAGCGAGSSTAPTTAAEDAEMKAALKFTKMKSTRAEKSTSIMIAAGRIAADHSHPCHGEVERLLTKHAVARDRPTTKISSEDAGATDAAVCKSALAASAVMRNLTTKAKQTNPTKAKIFTDQMKNDPFYDSDCDDGERRVSSVVIRDAQGEVNPHGRSFWVKADHNQAPEGEPARWVPEPFVRNFKYVAGRIEETKMYGFAVAFEFGKNECDRTGRVGQKRAIGSERNVSSLKKARATVAART